MTKFSRWCDHHRKCVRQPRRRHNHHDRWICRRLISGEGTELSGWRPSNDDVINISGGVVSGDVSGNEGNDRIMEWRLCRRCSRQRRNDLADFRSDASKPRGGRPSSTAALGRRPAIWHNTVGGVVARTSTGNCSAYRWVGTEFSGTLTMGDIGTDRHPDDRRTSSVLAGAGSRRSCPSRQGSSSRFPTQERST